ncbi:CAMK family protein kinase [Tritrichomonas foetus]|uniref:CAMK family protein kinase n=1 Tax=Tritrichomonas foetus TaxID=1144522 RepID=A0A1J4J745_9EUKA|nr:CAMK family protein kinase [Tritrichomonas foetus]|eukprot:OHS93261.1 CAMK family protein kinase [Tritrichomonas foetus]
MKQHQDELLAEARKALYQHGYEDMVPIGDGGFATIYKVKNRQYQEEFAVKLIDLALDDTKTLPESFRAEIRALLNLFHPHVIKIFDHFTSATLLYIILEYCPGGSLKDVIDRAGCIRPPIIYELCRQILDALHFCHLHEVAHRDVKPSNILIDKYGRAKLADFGLAQHFQNQQLSNIFGGSLPYLAPEILEMKPYDPMKADVWALGITFYEMASGRLPWETTTPEQLLIDIKSGPFKVPANFSPLFVSALRAMLEVNPKARCTLPEVMAMPIFQKPRQTQQQSRLARTSEFQPQTSKKMKKLTPSMLTVKSATARKSCAFSKKRLTSVIQTFEGQEYANSDGFDESNLPLDI